MSAILDVLMDVGGVEAKPSGSDWNRLEMSGSDNL